jgi:hypothetical protein
MTPAALLAHLRSVGAEVALSGNGNLRLRSAEPVPGDLLEQIRMNKAALVQLLALPANDVVIMLGAVAAKVSTTALHPRSTDRPEPADTDAWEERAGIIEHDGRLDRSDAEHHENRQFAAEWIDGLAMLRAMPPHRDFSVRRWRTMLADAEQFLAQWGTKARRLGWTAPDLFGAHRRAPFDRLDQAGLCLLLNGRPVTAMTATTATILCADGTVQTSPRQRMTESVPLWDIADEAGGGGAPDGWGIAPTAATPDVAFANLLHQLGTKAARGPDGGSLEAWRVWTNRCYRNRLDRYSPAEAAWMSWAEAEVEWDHRHGIPHESRPWREQACAGLQALGLVRPAPPPGREEAVAALRAVNNPVPAPKPKKESVRERKRRLRLEHLRR